MLKKSIFPLTSLTFATFALSLSPTIAEELTDSQRETLNERLQIIIAKSEKTLASRQATAIKAYKKGATSNTAALELYLKCIEKVNFTDAGKKNSAFRDWKRKNKEKHSEPGFKLALRHQLNWLLLTIDASRAKNATRSELSAKAQTALADIFEDGKQLEGYESILKRSALSSVFARAYGFNSFKIEEWPNSPLNLNDVYTKLVFPPLKEAEKTTALRSAWKKRITYEERAIELWAKKPEGKTIGMKKNLASPELEKFQSDQLPRLLWAMEKDIFEAGDQATAAGKMLNLIANYYTHNEATNWAQELQGLLSGKKEKEVEE